MRRLLQPTSADAFALALLALAVLVAGLHHARLFHRGLGPVFLMNAIGSTVVVLALIAQRVWVFVLGALSICVPSLVSIALSPAGARYIGDASSTSVPNGSRT